MEGAYELAAPDPGVQGPDSPRRPWAWDPGYTVGHRHSSCHLQAQDEGGGSTHF